MRLLELYKILEAGIANEPTSKRRKRTFGHKIGTINPYGIKNGEPAGPPDDDEDDGEFSDEDDLGPDMDYDDPSPPERDEPDLPSRRPDPVRPPKPFKEPEKATPMFGKSAKPSKALQGGKSAGSLKIDVRTLEALEQALENVRTGDDDLQSWIDDTLSEIGRAIRSGGELSLPKFVAASDDDVDDGGSGDED